MSVFGTVAAYFDETGIAVLGGVAVLVTILLLGYALLPDDPMSSRVRGHLRRREHLRTAGSRCASASPTFGPRRSARFGRCWRASSC